MFLHGTCNYPVHICAKGYAFGRICLCVYVCVCVCVTKKNTYLHAYQSNVCEKDAYCSLIHFMLPEMLA